jgi:hypothetical protein
MEIKVSEELNEKEIVFISEMKEKLTFLIFDSVFAANLYFDITLERLALWGLFPVSGL